MFCLSFKLFKFKEIENICQKRILENRLKINNQNNIKPIYKKPNDEIKFNHNTIDPLKINNDFCDSNSPCGAAILSSVQMKRSQFIIEKAHKSNIK